MSEQVSFGRFGPANVPYHSRPKGPDELRCEAEKAVVQSGQLELQSVFMANTDDPATYDLDWIKLPAEDDPQPDHIIKAE